MKKRGLSRLFIWLSTLTLSLSLSSCFSVASTSRKNINRISSLPNGPALSGDSLLKAIESQASDGLSFYDLDFEFIVPVKTLAKERENGELVKDENGKNIPIYKNQSLKVENGEINLRTDETNNTLYFDASLPIVYNESSFVTFKANYSNSTLFLGVVDTDTSLDNYSLKYKIEIIPDSSEDELSELIDNLFDLINKYGSIVDLGFVGSATKPAISSGNGDALTQAKKSLSISEGTSKEDGTYDYVFSLQAESIYYPITLNCASDGTLLNITLADESGNPIAINNEKHVSKIAFNSKVKDNSGFVSLSPSDANNYQSLINVERLLSRLYPLINEPSFVGNGSLQFEHIISEDEKSGVAKKETASIDVDIKADVSNLLNNKRERTKTSDSLPNAISTSFDLDVKVEEANGKVNSTKRALSVDMAREKDENGAYLDLGYAYLTTDAIATKMDFFTLDSMIGKILDLVDFENKSDLRGSFTESKVNDIKGVLNKFGIGKTINSILDAYLSLTGDESGLKGIETGEYERLVELIQSFKNAKHLMKDENGEEKEISTIDVTLNLAKIGLSGVVTISLYDGSLKRLAGISFSSVSLGSISFSGELYFADAKGINVQVTPTMLERTYFRRLPDLFDGLAEFTTRKQASLSIYGSMLSLAGDDGFEIEKGKGNLSFDLKSKNGTGSITFKDRKSTSKTQNYRLGLDIKAVYDGGHMVADQSDMFFMVNTPDSGAMPLVGYFSIDSLKGIMSLLKAFSKTEDEQFTKYLSWFQTAETSSLLARVMNGNEINPLLASGLIKSLSMSEAKRQVVAVINGEALSLEKNVTLTIGYEGDCFTNDGLQENTGRKKGSITTLNIQMETSSQKIDLTFELEDYIAPGTKTGDSYHWNAYSWNTPAFSGGENGIHDKKNYTNWSSIQFLLQYVLNSALLGRNESYQFGSDGTSASMVRNDSGYDYSTYHLSGSIRVSAELLGISLKKAEIKLDLYVYLKGATVKVYGCLDVPKISVLLGAFKANDGQYVSHFAYETDENNPQGTMYIERLKDNSLSKSSMHKIAGGDFLSNIGDWMVGYMMGIFDGNIPKTGYDMFHQETTSEDSGPIYIENVFTGKNFVFERDENNNPSWKNIEINIGGFNISKLTGTLSASLFGNAKAATLSGISLSGGISYTVISADIESASFSLVNVSSSGVYSEAWGKSNALSNYDSIGNGSAGFETVKSRVEQSGERSRLPGASFAGTFAGKNANGDNITIDIQRNGDIELKKNGDEYYDHSTSTKIESENWEAKIIRIYVKGKTKRFCHWNHPDGESVNATYTFQLQSDGTYKEINNQEGFNLNYAMV